MTRRNFLKLAAGAAGAAALGRVGWGVRWERYSLRRTDVDLEVAGLPAGFDGLRVAQLSDFHAGPCCPVEFARRAMDMALDARADLIALTGDYISVFGGRSEDLLADLLKSLTAPMGVWAILGNHDFFQDRRPAVERACRRAGVRLLRNSGVLVHRGGDSLWLAGVDDPSTARDDLDAALRGAPGGLPVLLMAHSPDIIPNAARARVGAVLAGHTHGGQICVPFYGPLVVPSRFGRRYAYGSYRVGSTAMFVTRGVGMVPPLVRLFCPPEVAIVTLRPAPEGRQAP